MLVRDRCLELDGAGRDLVTGAADTLVASEATVHARLDERHSLSSLMTGPELASTSALIGRPVAAGFRAAASSVIPPGERGGPLALLLDDLPVAALISGYTRLYSGDIPAETAAASMKPDVCAGWRSDGTMMISVRAGAGIPVPIGPPAPEPDTESTPDPIGWHDIGPLESGAMRRRRLIDVTDDGPSWTIRAMFRDTHVPQGEHETVLHEYSLTATVDAATHEFSACAAVPHVLPFGECPQAAASAGRLVGTKVESVREHVRRDLRGVTTCTHLNDLLRSLGDILSLVESLGNLERRRTT